MISVDGGRSSQCMCGYESLVSGRLLKPALSNEETERGRGGGGDRETEGERNEWNREESMNRRRERDGITEGR